MCLVYGPLLSCALSDVNSPLFPGPVAHSLAVSSFLIPTRTFNVDFDEICSGVWELRKNEQRHKGKIQECR